MKPREIESLIKIGNIVECGGRFVLRATHLGFCNFVGQMREMTRKWRVLEGIFPYDFQITDTSTNMFHVLNQFLVCFYLLGALSPDKNELENLDFLPCSH